MVDSSPSTPPPSKSSSRVITSGSNHDLEFRETVQGSRPGDRFVRVATYKGFQRVRSGYLVTRPGTGQPKGAVGRAVLLFKKLLFGGPIPTAGEAHERL